MATQRDAAQLSEFVKFATIGAAIFGVVTRIADNRNGSFLIMSPAGYRARPGEKFERFEEVAVGLTTDLQNKVRQSDAGSILLFVFAGTRPTSQDPLKLFNVFELTADEAKKILASGKLNPEWEKAVPADTRNGAVAKVAAPF